MKTNYTFKTFFSICDCIILMKWHAKPQVAKWMLIMEIVELTREYLFPWPHNFISLHNNIESFILSLNCLILQMSSKSSEPLLYNNIVMILRHTHEPEFELWVKILPSFGNIQMRTQFFQVKINFGFNMLKHLPTCFPNTIYFTLLKFPELYKLTCKIFV